MRVGVQARRKLVGPRQGINRLLNGARDRELSAEGVRDFNDVNAVSLGAGSGGERNFC